ncbi:MAG: hypothetical protein Q7S45_00710 [Candidatus Curtissbacteria bacterium]|nr:hypothetical protein [Candidatus Curtissbacteria bacterium]
MIRRISSLLATFSIILSLTAAPAFAANESSKAAGRTQGQLRACQVKENTVKQRANRLTKLAANIETKFDSIAARVEKYYTTKVVPSGKTVSNYDSLVAAIAAKKTAVQTALSTAQNDVNSFSCTSSDPKSQLQTFRVDMQNVKSALKDYRTSIKNLIVAVRSVTGAMERESTKSTKP